MINSNYHNNKLIFNNSLVLFLKLFLTSVFGLITSRFVLKGLGASDFGLYNVVGGIVVLMAFVNTIMVTSTYRFIAYEIGRNNAKAVNEIFNKSFIIHLALSLVVLLLSETLGIFYIRNYLNVEVGNISNAIYVLRFSTYATILNIISIPFQGLITANEKFKYRAFVDVLKSFLKLIIALVIIKYMGNRLRLYAALIFIINVVPLVMFYLYCKKNYYNSIRWNYQRKISGYKEIIGFSFWILFGAAASIGKTQGSALILNNFFGTIINASYGIANQINSLVQVFARNIGQAAVPQITKSYSSGNEKRTINLAVYISKYTYILMLFPAIPILLKTDILLDIWLDEVPPYTSIFCKLMIINALVESLGNGIPTVVQATGKIKYFQIILSTTSILSLPLAYLFFKLNYPPYFMVISILLSSSLNVVLRQILLKYLIDFDIKFFLKNSYLKVFYVSLFITPIFFIERYFNDNFLSLFLIVIISLIWIIVGINLVGITRQERELLLKFMKIRK